MIEVLNNSDHVKQGMVERGCLSTLTRITHHFQNLGSPVVIPPWSTSCQHSSVAFGSACDHAFIVLLCEDIALDVIITSRCGRTQAFVIEIHVTLLEIILSLLY